MPIETVGTARFEQERCCDALIRLPIDTVLDQRDRIRVVARFGVPQNTEITYDIAGPPLEGPSGLVVPVNVTNPKVE